MDFEFFVLFVMFYCSQLGRLHLFVVFSDSRFVRASAFHHNATREKKKGGANVAHHLFTQVPSLFLARVHLLA